jgi:hypothetical protein
LLGQRRAAYSHAVEWIGRGLLSVGMVWSLVASFVGGARSLTLSTALFVFGIIVMAMT